MTIENSKMFPMNLQLFAEGKGENNDPNVNTDPNKGTDPNGAPNEPNKTETTFTQEQLNSLIKQEKEKYKTKLNEYENKLKDFEGNAVKISDFEKQIGDLTEKYKDFDSIKAKHDVYENAFTEMLNKKKEAVPENFRKLIPSNLSVIDTIQWIDNAEQEGLFSKKAIQTSTGSNTNVDVDTSKMTAFEKMKLGFKK